MFQENQELNYYYFGDWDPFGMDIYLNYLFGSRHLVQEGLNLGFLQFIGLNVLKMGSSLSVKQCLKLIDVD